MRRSGKRTPSGSSSSTASFRTNPPLVERDSGQGRHELHPAKTLGARGALARVDQHRADPAPGPFRAHEESADPCRVRRRIEPVVGAVRELVSSEQRAPPAPSAARHGSRNPRLFHDEVGPVIDQPRVHSEEMLQRARELLLRVVAFAQPQHGIEDERTQRLDVAGSCPADREPFGHQSSGRGGRKSRIGPDDLRMRISV